MRIRRRGGRGTRRRAAASIALPTNDKLGAALFCLAHATLAMELEEPPPVTPSGGQGDQSPDVLSSLQRKKLGAHLMESDERRFLSSDGARTPLDGRYQQPTARHRSTSADTPSRTEEGRSREWPRCSSSPSTAAASSPLREVADPRSAVRGSAKIALAAQLPRRAWV
jgi:hypothetical protein